MVVHDWQKPNLSLQLDYQTKIEKIPLIVDETSIYNS